MSDLHPTESEWRKVQSTPIVISLSFAYALWDFCCAKGRDEEAGLLAKAINAAIPGYFEKAANSSVLDEIPMILKGHKLHAALNKEYANGLWQGARVGAFVGAVGMLGLALLVFGSRWLIQKL